MNERKPTRLELHRAKFHKDGKKAPMLPVAVLDQEENTLIANDLMSRLRALSATQEPTPDLHYKTYAEVLSDWGVMCPHPTDKRLYDGSKIFTETDMFRWFDCTMCGCAVINPLWKGQAQPFKLPKPRPAPPIVRNTPTKGGGGAA